MDSVCAQVPAGLTEVDDNDGYHECCYASFTAHLPNPHRSEDPEPSTYRSLCKSIDSNFFDHSCIFRNDNRKKYIKKKGDKNNRNSVSI